MRKNKSAIPIVKWVGCKKKMLKVLTPLVPNRYSIYCEPFMGGGSLLFELLPRFAFLNDINSDLMRVYRVVKDNVEDLICVLQDFKYEPECFHEIRDWVLDRDKYSSMPDIQKAARTIYLNRTFPGRFSVSDAGDLIAYYSGANSSRVFNIESLRAASEYLSESVLSLTSGDYADMLPTLPKGAFTYLDPPYDLETDASNYTGISRCSFPLEEQVRLRKCCDELNRRGMKFMMTNAATDFVMEQYSEYNILLVSANYDLDPIAARRGDIDEVVIRNYKNKWELGGL
jgi:DNA adenine methylase